MTLRRAALVSIVSLLAACAAPGGALDYGDPTSINTPTKESGIVAWVESPEAGASVASPSARVVLAAYSDDGASLHVTMATGDSDPVDAVASGSGASSRFSAALPLEHGLNPVTIEIANDDRSRFRRIALVLSYSGAAPGIAFKVLAPAAADGSCSATAPATNELVSGGSVCVRGRATKGASRIAHVQVGVKGGALAETAIDDAGIFVARVDLGADAKARIAAVATDVAGRSTRAEADVASDSTAPALALTGPQTSGTIFTDASSVVLTGTATDATGIATLRVRTSRGGSSALPVASPWTATVPLAPGKNDVAIVAVDLAGNVATLPVTIVQTRVLTLHAPKQNQGGTSLLLDKAALQSLVSEADQKSLKMATIPLRPAIVATLHQIRDPEQNGVDTSQWGTAELNLAKLLRMTPDTANLKGSSIEELLGIAAAIGLPPARVLAQLLDISVTTSTFVDLETTADVLCDQLIGTHPNAEKDASGQPVVSVSMYDVFQDLHTLGPRFGPTGMHPGFLTGQTESKVLLPGFRMSLPVKSNLTQYDGVDASAGDRSALFELDGPDALTLDFTSDQFGIVGLADEPAIDLSFAITENPQFLYAGADQTAGPDPSRPGFFRGDGGAWSVPPWQIESIVAETAYRQYVEAFAATGYARELKYDAGSIQNAAIIDWNRGWVTVTTAGGIGNPPMPQYVWDILLETAELRLHDGGLAEGQANLGFSLHGVPIGLTADDLVAKVKPTLMAQAGKLSSLIAGTSGLADSGADFYWVEKTTNDGGYLFFRAPGDAAKAYSYAKPGFYSDAALTAKVSSAGAATGTSDTAHEKLAPQAGQTLYVGDDTGGVYRVDVIAVMPDGVSLRVSPGGSS